MAEILWKEVIIDLLLKMTGLRRAMGISPREASKARLLRTGESSER